MKVCPICGKAFESKGKQIYCSKDCYEVANAKFKHERYKAKAQQKQWSWSLKQAGRLYNLCYDKEKPDVLERLAKHVYNNYKRK